MFVPFCVCIRLWHRYKAAVLPLSKKLTDKAMPICAASWLSSSSVDYDDAGSIGKRYRREDEIGTPFCITVDFESRGGWLRNRP